MSVSLGIRDGDPWWLSPDVWVVPGNNPEGSSGQPVAGEPLCLSARVHNDGDEPVNDATVRFYYANPALGFDRSTATLVGVAFVSLNARQSTDVLCLAPCVPAFADGGHVCILAEVFHPVLDPLPPPTALMIPGDRHVAQRSLMVIKATGELRRLAVEVHNPSRHSRVFSIRTNRAEVASLAPVLESAGLSFDPAALDGDVVDSGFAATPFPDDRDLELLRSDVDDLIVEPGQRSGLAWVGRLRGDAALLHVMQLADGAPLGGLSLLLLRKERR